MNRYVKYSSGVPLRRGYTGNVDKLRTAVVTLCLIVFASSLFAADRPLLVCFGDSITAGYGLSAGESYPDALQRDLDQQGYRYTVANEGTSGATTKDAVAKLPAIVAMHPAIVIVEFGGNDGLRGFPLDLTRQNLDRILTTLEAAHIRVLLAGITLPPNYGSDYIHQFDQIFVDLAAKHRTATVPMIYRDLIKIPGTIQGDGIHPTAKGSQIVAKTLLTAVKPMLRKTP